jgi:predicted ATPase
MRPVFGRSEELARLTQAFAQGARILTIVGPGGMGKTCLAQAAAERFSAPLFVDLASARSTSTVLSTLLRALDLRPSSSPARNRERVLAALAGRSLLVLDNAERALDEVAELGPALASVLPVVITSRESLRIPEETVLELGPLGTEAQRQMLLARTQAARAGASPSPEEQALLEEIARDLEGIPLALELAGSRLGVMSAATFASKLHRRFDLLVSSQRGGDPRHRTLRAALDASFELLSEDEQRVLAFISTCAGGFDLAAAEALLDGLLPAALVIAAVEGLQQKSWLVRKLNGPELRFELYETLRGYAEERLRERGEHTAAITRHAEHYLRLAARESPARERDNLLAAFSQDNLQSELRARALLALEETLSATESSRVHRGLLDRLRGQPGLSPEQEARLTLARARASDKSGEAGPARAELREARRQAQRTSDRRLRLEIATAEITFGYMHGATRGAVARGRRIARWAAPIGAPKDQARFLIELGVALHMAGEREEALRRYEEALRVAETAQDHDQIGRALACLGFLKQDRGALVEAEAAYQRALKIHDALGNRDVRGVVLGYLGNLERRKGRSASAERYYQRALGDLERIDDRPWIAVVRMDLGLLHLDQGRYAAAETELTRASSELAQIGHPELEAMTHSALSIAVASLGDHARAEPLLARAKVLLSAGSRAGFVALHAAWMELERAGAPAVSAARAVLSAHASHLGSDDYLRLASQLLERSLARYEAPELQSVFDRQGAYFALPGQGRVELEGPLRRVLAALLHARVETPGAPISVQALARTGWPDEQILEAAAKNRVRVAIATLRSLGLRAALHTRGDGYLIPEELPLLLA